MNTPHFKRGAALACFLALAVSALVIPATLPAAQPDTDRYIVSFSHPAEGKAALRAAGAKILLDLPSQGIAAVRIPAQAVDGLSQRPGIEYIEKDVLRYPMAQTTPWGILAVQADLVSDAAAGTQKICIIDSGYALGHEDLPNGPNVTHDGASMTDLCYHGSHVAGTIAAVTNGVGVVGVLPNGTVKLHIVKVFGDDCRWSYASDLIAALDQCTAPGVDANIVSMSLGGGFKSRSEDRAFARAYDAGVLSVAAAGNDGNTRKSYPASYDSVISVAAVDSTGNVADFSQQNDQVELAAPGVAVRSTVGMGAGTDESLEVNLTGYDAIALEDSASGSESGKLYRCNAVDGLGSPGDCTGIPAGDVCLISRGDISFAAKVQECERAGGSATVIFNNLPGLFSGTLAGAATAKPSVGISREDGEWLAANAVPNGSATVSVNTGNYSYYDGTSMATPHVSGVAALVWSQNPTCTNVEIRNALDGTADDLGPAGRDPAYGYGLIQAAAAAAVITDDTSPYFCGGGGSGGGGGGGGDPEPPQQCTLLQQGEFCSSNSQCCSNSCKGKPGQQTCK